MLWVVANILGICWMLHMSSVCMFDFMILSNVFSTAEHSYFVEFGLNVNERCNIIVQL